MFGCNYQFLSLIHVIPSFPIPSLSNLSLLIYCYTVGAPVQGCTLPELPRETSVRSWVCAMNHFVPHLAVLDAAMPWLTITKSACQPISNKNTGFSTLGIVLIIHFYGCTIFYVLWCNSMTEM